jgi:ribonuclease P protein component
MALPKSQRLVKISHQYLGKVKQEPLEVKLIHSDSNQAGVIIPKRFVAKACDRNRIRRICLELIRQVFKKQEIGGILIRVYTYPGNFETIPAVLSQCLHQLRS